MKDPLVKVAALAIAAWVVAVGALVAKEQLGPQDLAKGKPWRASSSYGVPPKPDYFFHTAFESQPWVEVDLGAPQKLGRLEIVNRNDPTVLDRAVPLVLEVGDDQRTWKQVGRRDEPFETWSVDLEPVTARYVRARVERSSYLHLKAVKAYP